jgi:putative spermidine/putrescine transport system permease protein
VPNLRSALVSSVFVTLAVVLGEFTIARMLARTNLQTALFEINLSDGQIAAAVSLLILGGTILLMVTLDLIVALQERRIRPSTRSDVS